MPKSIIHARAEEGGPSNGSPVGEQNGCDEGGRKHSGTNPTTHTAPERWGVEQEWDVRFSFATERPKMKKLQESRKRKALLLSSGWQKLGNSLLSSAESGAAEGLMRQ